MEMVCVGSISGDVSYQPGNTLCFILGSIGVELVWLVSQFDNSVGMEFPFQEAEETCRVCQSTPGPLKHFLILLEVLFYSLKEL